MHQGVDEVLEVLCRNLTLSEICLCNLWLYLSKYTIGFAVNLAVALAKKCELKVGLLDADVFGPSVPMMMKIHGKPEVNKGALSFSYLHSYFFFWKFKILRPHLLMLYSLVFPNYYVILSHFFVTRLFCLLRAIWVENKATISCNSCMFAWFSHVSHGIESIITRHMILSILL